MIRVEVARTFPVPVSEGFAYITDTNNWDRYWPGLYRIRGIRDPAQARWGDSGDTVTLVMGMLARKVELTMMLEEFRKDALVRYTSRQRGLPDAWHERHFRVDPTGFEYRLIVAFEPRKGLEAAPIGWQLFVLGNAQSDSTASLPLFDTYATRLLAQALSGSLRSRLRQAGREKGSERNSREP